MNLKRQLLLVSLLTLVLPWAGCQFIRETESALRAGQQQMLAGSARALADTLAQYPQEFPDNEGVLIGDQLYGHSLGMRPTVDGYFEDWPLERNALRALRGDEGPVRFALGVFEQALYLYVEVTDADIVYAAPGTIALGDGARYADQVVLASVTATGRREAFAFTAEAPGALVTYVRNEFGFAPEPTVAAWWQDVPGGYQLEARVPLSLLGDRLGVVVRDTDDDRSAGTTSTSFAGSAPGRFVTRSARLEAIVAGLVQPGMRLVVTDETGWRLALAGSIARVADDDGAAVSNWLRVAYEALVEPGNEASLAEPDASGRERQPYVQRALGGAHSSGWFRDADRGTAIAAVAEPVDVDGRTRGAVVLQQGTDAILSLTNRGLARLLNVTLIAMLLVAVGLLGYATWLSRRIRRLSVAAEQALARDALGESLPSAGAADEIGDLSRSFSQVLGQLGDYNEYLRTLASKLSHELRTPLAIVTSSLENLEHESLGDAAAEYTGRARDGTERLRRILAAMSEASRVEEMIGTAEPERVDLAELLRSAVAAYRDVYDARQFELSLSGEPAPVDAAPELLIQMLDKLVDNAADFSSEGDTIGMALERADGAYLLSVSNPGPPLPERMRHQLFDSMVTVRSDGDDRHLGLGLYVARLIAEGHGGRIVAENTDDGVRFTVKLPARKPG